ncbi:glutaredoxin family protein [Pseudalkalibacillus hwajinpoensis]|uniref:Glutaredoxin family protein n=1 Tax=Guptibacillus hwajinpoensis TaxID=208199 RepID=A0A4U1MJ75_9BACL|nr:glutaredoxin family protein [Pseudalkalibacillus hwajinpoensis]
MLGGKESNMEQLTLYTITSCIKCVKIKSYLKEKEIPFEEINLFDQPHKQQELINYSGDCSVPTIIFKGKVLNSGDL